MNHLYWARLTVTTALDGLSSHRTTARDGPDARPHMAIQGRRNQGGRRSTHRQTEFMATRYRVASAGRSSPAGRTHLVTRCVARVRPARRQRRARYIYITPNRTVTSPRTVTTASTPPTWQDLVAYGSRHRRQSSGDDYRLRVTLWQRLSRGQEKCRSGAIYGTFGTGAGRFGRIDRCRVAGWQVGSGAFDGRVRGSAVTAIAASVSQWRRCYLPPSCHGLTSPALSV